MKRLIILKSNKGTSMILFALAIVLVMGCASVTVDVGLVANEKAALSNAVDSAALAAAQELINNRENAAAVAREYLDKNGLHGDDADIRISGDGNSVQVEYKKKVNYFFAKVLGYKNGEVDKGAKAKIMPVSSVSSGLRPFAIVDQTLKFNETYTLKEGAGSGSSGNYGLLALGGTGANNLMDNIINGYDNSLKVGDYVSTEPGNKSGPTKTAVQNLISQCNHIPRCTAESYAPDCSRIVTISVVDTLNVSGRSSIQIVGFASFFIENIVDNGGHTEITGKFIKTVAQGAVSESQTDYGLKGIKLVE